jgi:hypothetical protein
MSATGLGSEVLAGPLENNGFPEQLTARVVTPGERPRIHGYDVQGDLALHYGPHDVLYLSLTGELPEPVVSAAFGVVLTFVAPLSVAHAPTHGAVLSHLCGATSTATVGVAAIGLAEQARSMVLEHQELFAWLAERKVGLPARFVAQTSSERALVERLRDALGSTGFRVPVLDSDPTPDAAPLAVMFALGLTRAEQLVTAIVTARLPVAVAEALAGTPVDFKHYPINLPRFRYEQS